MVRRMRKSAMRATLLCSLSVVALHRHLADQPFEDLLLDREIVQHVADEGVDQTLQFRRARHATLLEAQIAARRTKIGEPAPDRGRTRAGRPVRLASRHSCAAPRH